MSIAVEAGESHVCGWRNGLGMLNTNFSTTSWQRLTWPSRAQRAPLQSVPLDGRVKPGHDVNWKSISDHADFSREDSQRP